MMTARWIEKIIGPLVQKRDLPAGQNPNEAVAGRLPHRLRGRRAVPDLCRWHRPGRPCGRNVPRPGRPVRAECSGGTPIRAIVGDDPVEFVDDFVATYAEGSCISKERQRLNDAIDQVAGERSNTEGAEQ